MSFYSNMSKKEKLGVALAAAIVLFALLDRIIVAPISYKFKRINSEIKMNELQLAQGLRNMNQRDSIALEYKKYLVYIKSNYSEGEEVAKLLEEIENMGRSAGVSITDIKPQPPKQVDVYRYYLIEIDAEGRMDSLMTFLHQLGSSKELFRAGKTYISVKDKETSTAKASILVTKVVVP